MSNANMFKANRIIPLPSLVLLVMFSLVKMLPVIL